METGILLDPTLAFTAAPRRVVSLVPSMTASLFDLGLGSSLAAVTDYCSEPADRLIDMPRIGGPKNPAVEKILSLRPDLILANQEENDQESVEQLARAGVPVWLTFPITIQDVIRDLWTLANLFRNDASMRQVDQLEKSVEWAAQAAADLPAVRYFCPIWQDHTAAGEAWWMTFNDQTYPHHVLQLFGGVNIAASRSRRYPLAADLGLAADENPAGRDTRYPRLNLDEIRAAQPELVLLPDEPYRFTGEDRDVLQVLLADTPAGRSERILTLDGTLVTWHGTRLARAVAELPALFY